MEKAVTWHEVVARLGERPRSGGVLAYNPHILSSAMRRLESSGRLVRTSRVTKGGHVVKLLQLPEARGQRRAVEDAAASKAAAMARYLSWTQSARLKNHVIGGALEKVLAASLLAANKPGLPVSYQVLGGAPRFDVARLAGVLLPGSLDSAAVLNLYDSATGASKALHVLFEAKNIRDWIYPSSAQLYQLLFKSALVQQERPALGVVPVLVARRVHHTTFTFAQALGFFAMETRFQYVYPPPGDTDGMTLLKDRLGFDLRRISDGETSPALLGRLRKQLPALAESTAAKWAANAPGLIDAFSMMQQSLTHPQRKRAYQDIRAMVEASPEFGEHGGGFVDLGEESEDDDWF